MDSRVYTDADFSYAAYNKPYRGNAHQRRCIDGKVTGCGNCVGYCTYSEHEGFLTRELRKKHDCIGKACFYYRPKHSGRESA